MSSSRSLPEIADALQRVQAVLTRRPETGLGEDAAAAARWTGGTHVVASHPQGLQLETDLPPALGGMGEHVSPGWLFRAGLASCAATSIVLAAAAEGIALSALEVRALSTSDTRGLLGMKDGDGFPVDAGPAAMQLQVRIAAVSVAPERLRAVVEQGIRCSPIPAAVRSARDLALHIEVAAS